MKNNKYNFHKVLKRAKNAGQRDGKNEVPKLDWNRGSIPYLNLVHRQYVDLQETNLLGFKSKVRELEDSKAAAEQRVISNESAAQFAAKQLDDAEASVAAIQAKIDGELEDMPSSLPAKRRNLSTWAYSIILLICSIAELTVTIPALQFLLGEKRQFAVLLAFALGTVTFFGAHLIGTTLKKRQDRSAPQPITDVVLALVLTGFIFLAILFLAYIRANQTLPFANNLVELPESWRLEVLWALWAVWQMTFFTLGAVAAFKHHSETAGRLNAAKRILRIRKVQHARAESRLFKSRADLKGLEIDWSASLNKQIGELKQRERLLQAQYMQVCALYVDSNIHSRRQSIKGDHDAFIPIELEAKDIDFLGQAPRNNNHWDISAMEVAGSSL